MKKVVIGLVGIVLSALGFAGAGCQSTIHEEVSKIKYHSNEIRKIIKAEPGGDYQVFEFKEGEPFSVIVWGKDGTRSIVYFDLDKDGEYEEKRTITIPKKLDIKVLPPLKPEKNYQDEYLPKKEKKKKLWTFYN